MGIEPRACFTSPWQRLMRPRVLRLDNWWIEVVTEKCSDSNLALVMGTNVVDGLDGDLQHFAGGTDKFRICNIFHQ